MIDNLLSLNLLTLNLPLAGFNSKDSYCPGPGFYRNDRCLAATSSVLGLWVKLIVIRVLIWFSYCIMELLLIQDQALWLYWHGKYNAFQVFSPFRCQRNVFCPSSKKKKSACMWESQAIQLSSLWNQTFFHSLWPTSYLKVSWCYHKKPICIYLVKISTLG
jgi:hypothetical protein